MAETVTVLSLVSTRLPLAVTVTVPALVVAPTAKVSVFAVERVKSAATAPVPASAPTVTVNASLDLPDSVAVTVVLPPVSETEEDDSARVRVGRVSSSVRVRVTFVGAATPLPPVAVPETVTDLSGESTSLPLAVIVTSPLLAVAPAAMVRVFSAERPKSAATAPVPASAPTVTVTASLDLPDSVAVTDATPPVSEIDAGDSDSARVGNASSSVSVRVSDDGATTLLPPATVPETVTDLSGESTSLPLAVIVTSPLLAVAPAAMVRVFAAERSKSAATAPVPAVASTVTVTASLDLPDSVAVTDATPPVSEIEDGDNASATVGNASSSVSVRVSDDGAATLLPPAAVPETVTDLSGESTSLPFAVTVTSPLLVVAPAAMVSVFAAERPKSAATAPVPASAPTVTVTASLDLPDSVAVTDATPPVSEIDDGDSASATVGRSSSSLSVRVTFDGATTLLPPATVPETVTDLSGESTSLPLAVIVTSPLLAVAPAAMVSVFSAERPKSAATAPVPAAAPTVTVTASLDLPDSVAVTDATPPVSEIDDGDSDSATVGNVSSSVSVNATPVGFATPLPPTAVAETVTSLSGAWISLSLAVTVTSPLLAVAPAAMVSVAPAERVKSGAAVTVTVTASLEAPDSAAVTDATPPFSEIEVWDRARVRVGRSSSSVSVSVTAEGALTSPLACPATNMRLSGESVSLPTAVIVTVPVLVVAPLAKTSSVVPDRVTSDAMAPAPGVTVTVTVAAPEAASSSVAVTVVTPPVSEMAEDDSASAALGRATMGSHSP